MKWIKEKYKESLEFGFPYSEKLFSQMSPFQKVEVYDSPTHGKILLNDDCFMITERDEHIYHEMIVHPAMQALGQSAKNILIIGGGDGGTAREVLRYHQVQKVVMVEIDGAVVEACRAHIPQTSAQLSDPRLELLIEDGVEFVKKSEEKFDLIIVDSTDPVGPAQPLFGVEFYQNLKKCLNSKSLVVSQGESPFYETEMQKKLFDIMTEVFGWVKPYNFTNMSYPGGLWTFMSSGLGDIDPQKRELSSQEIESEGFLGYYNSDIHQAAFALPTQMKKQLLGRNV